MTTTTALASPGFRFIFDVCTVQEVFDDHFIAPGRSSFIMFIREEKLQKVPAELQCKQCISFDIPASGKAHTTRDTRRLCTRLQQPLLAQEEYNYGMMLPYQSNPQLKLLFLQNLPRGHFLMADACTNHFSAAAHSRINISQHTIAEVWFDGENHSSKMLEANESARKVK